MNLRIITLRDIMIQSYLVEKIVYAHESQQSKCFKYIGRCVYTNLFYLMSEKLALSSLSEFQMFALIDHFKVTVAILQGVQIFWGEREARHKMQMVD